jgi:F-type H+-transporting ATPase subunit b
MKRLLVCVVLAASTLVFAQRGAENPSAHSEERHIERQDTKEERDLTGWKWANFFILAGLLGWLLSKNAPAFFEGRNREIQRGIAEAGRLKLEAERDLRVMEDRLHGLQMEIETLRAEARRELQSEGERIKAETVQILAKIRSQAEQEIAAAGKAARQELKAHSVNLAVQLAKAKVRSRLTPQSQDGLVSSFVSDLRATRPGVN